MHVTHRNKESNCYFHMENYFNALILNSLKYVPYTEKAVSWAAALDIENITLPFNIANVHSEALRGTVLKNFGQFFKYII